MTAVALCSPEEYLCEPGSGTYSDGVGRAIPILLTCVGLVLTGCQSTAPQPVVSLSDRQAPTLRRTEYRGHYTLYRLEPVGHSEVVREVHLGAKQPLGFRVRENGVVAVAGDSELPVGPGSYVWKMQADPGQLTPAGAVILVAVVVVVVGLTAWILYDVNRAREPRHLNNFPGLL